jgi:hypothetical protein
MDRRIAAENAKEQLMNIWANLDGLADTPDFTPAFRKTIREVQSEMDIAIAYAEHEERNARDREALIRNRML